MMVEFGPDRMRSSRLADERGIVMIVALGLIVALLALSLQVATSSQMAALTSGLARQSADAFHTADGGASYALDDDMNFVPNMVARSVDLTSSPGAVEATVTASYLSYRALPGNLLVRTTDGRMRPAQFGQNEGLGRMYLFDLDSRENVKTAGVDSASRVHLEVAKPGPCADCGG